MITPELKERFQEDGAVVLRSVFSDYWIEMVQRGIEKNLEKPSKYAEWLNTGENTGTYFNDYCNWKKIPEFQEFVEHSPAAEIAGNLMECEVCSIWMPVDPIPLDSTLRLVRGSHQWGWFKPRKFATENDYLPQILPDSYDSIPVEEIDSGKHYILEWSIEPGDCVVFHMRTIHGAAGNSSSTHQRRVLATRWLGDDASLAVRPWEVSPPLEAVFENPPSIEQLPTIWRLQK
ncbi:hypothetical protein L9F63_013283 [Diploptera punctata]|uniref:Phytanoyl-CoA dioxygenase n=1 Tax=Diploptera punctata TaxID=6984 RepID=A0AAD8AAM6_DIPPU|nr:hypothetical protein L9F63_013283 [Diploptera punctata]